MQTFSLRHDMIQPNEGLVIAHHNKILDEIIHITRQSFYYNCVRRKTLTHLDHSISGEEVSHGGIFT